MIFCQTMHVNGKASTVDSPVDLLAYSPLPPPAKLPPQISAIDSLHRRGSHEASARSVGGRFVVWLRRIRKFLRPGSLAAPADQPPRSPHGTKSNPSTSV